MNSRARSTRGAFTLVELLVVVAIIAILVTLLFPAIGAVQRRAKNLQTEAQLAALDQGLEAFRSEEGLSGTYPPSKSDSPDDEHLIADPNSDDDVQDPDTQIAGAHLLVHALLGADLLGPTGFRDLNRNGHWADDTHGGPSGWYGLDESTADPLVRRYGSGGYVSDDVRAQTATLAQIRDNGNLVTVDSTVSDGSFMEQLLFTDPWQHPILYYRANRAARWATGPGENGDPGIYHQEDNGFITGSVGGELATTGIDFGPGPIDGNSYFHRLAVAVNTPPVMNDVDGVSDVLTAARYENSFARFIHDPSSRVRNEPVRKDSYLLISAGGDGIFGTSDDVTNWNRERE